MLIHDILAHAVKLYPDKTALVDGSTRYTYAEASERVHRLAAGLLSLGLQPGDNIAILANNSHRYWETYFVASVAGMPLAPLNTRLAAPEYEFIVNDGEIKALFLGPEFAEMYGHFRANSPGIKHVIMLNGELQGAIQYEDLVSANEPLAAVAPLIPEVDAILCNCSAPEAMDQAMPVLATFGKPFGAYANGFQQITSDFLKDSPTVDALSARPEMTPELYADYAMGWVAQGATLVGGETGIGNRQCRTRSPQGRSSETGGPGNRVAIEARPTRRFPSARHLRHLRGDGPRRHGDVLRAADPAAAASLSPALHHHRRRILASRERPRRLPAARTAGLLTSPPDGSVTGA